MNADAAVEATTLIRRAVESDRPLIMTSWVGGYRTLDESRRSLPSAIYYAGHNALAERLLARCTTLIACSSEDPSQVLGWVIGEHAGKVAVLHYVYVKQFCRRLGIGTRLVSELVRGSSGIQHTHRTSDGKKLLKPFGSVFNPYLAGIL